MCNNINTKYTKDINNKDDVKDTNKINKINNINKNSINTINNINTNTTSIKYYTYNKRKYTYTSFNKKRLKKYKRCGCKAVARESKKL